MPISLEETRKIAQLAHLELSPSELEMYAHQLADIVGYIDQLEQLSVAGETLLATAGTPMREDRAENAATLEEMEQNAPQFAAGHFVVPRVVAPGE